VPGGGPGREQGEVQVGAGTQGDVTTGSSGTKPKKADAADRGKNDKPDAGAARAKQAPAAGARADGKGASR
jgi:hypothetical protein